MKRVIAVALALAVLVLLYGTANAARSTAQCWFADGYLYATGLPTTYPYSVTTEPYPTGTTSWSVDGTLAVQTWASDAYFWVRKGGGGLFKPGAGLNDYKPIAECHA